MNENKNCKITEKLIKDYYDYNQTKFNIFSIEKELNYKIKRFYYYTSAVAASLLIIFTLFFTMYNKPIEDTYEIVSSDLVDFFEIETFFAEAEQVDTYLSILDEIDNEISLINEELYFNYDEYVAYLGF